MFKRVFLGTILILGLVGILWYQCSKTDTVELEPVKTVPEPAVIVAPPPEPATVPAVPAPEPKSAPVVEPQEVAAFEIFYEATGGDCRRKLFMWGEDTSLEELVKFFKWDEEKYSADVNVSVEVFDKKISEEIMNDVFHNNAEDKYPEYTEAHKATVDFSCSDEYITTYLEMSGKDIPVINLMKEHNTIPCGDLEKLDCKD